MTQHDDDDEEAGYEKLPRAGFIPFMRTINGPIYLMMVASNPRYGGPRPMISKGKIEAGETPMIAAMREAEEELGLKQRNLRGRLIEVFQGRVALFSGAYDLTVYASEIQDRYDFDKWCDETEYTVWMSLEEFRTKGRRDHVKFIEELERQL